MTSRIYYTDPYCRRFEASVIKTLVHDGRPAALLDRTAFYPTSGGQPFDTGKLFEAGRAGEVGRVDGERRGPYGSAIDVIDTIDVDDDVVHVL